MSKHRQAANGGVGRDVADVRIIGGKYRGSKLRYHGDPITRPMKHRVREAIFNLISTESQGRHAIDLFAGTGALGLEALSRGSSSATFIEKHVPTARIVEENISTLGVEEETTLLQTSAFLWSKRDLVKFERGRGNDEVVSADSSLGIPLSPIPWLVFCSPPYSFYVERADDMLSLIASLIEHAPDGSIFVVEADQRFDFETLAGEWDVRNYPPAFVGVLRN